MNKYIGKLVNGNFFKGLIAENILIKVMDITKFNHGHTDMKINNYTDGSKFITFDKMHILLSYDENIVNSEDYSGPVYSCQKYIVDDYCNDDDDCINNDNCIDDCVDNNDNCIDNDDCVDDNCIDDDNKTSIEEIRKMVLENRGHIYLTNFVMLFISLMRVFYNNEGVL